MLPNGCVSQGGSRNIYATLPQLSSITFLVEKHLFKLYLHLYLFLSVPVSSIQVLSNRMDKFQETCGKVSNKGSAVCPSGTGLSGHVTSSGFSTGSAKPRKSVFFPTSRRKKNLMITLLIPSSSHVEYLIQFEFLPPACSRLRETPLTYSTLMSQTQHICYRFHLFFLKILF